SPPRTSMNDGVRSIITSPSAKGNGTKGQTGAHASDASSGEECHPEETGAGGPRHERKSVRPSAQGRRRPLFEVAADVEDHVDGAGALLAIHGKIPGEAEGDDGIVGTGLPRLVVDRCEERERRAPRIDREKPGPRRRLRHSYVDCYGLGGRRN